LVARKMKFPARFIPIIEVLPNSNSRALDLRARASLVKLDYDFANELLAGKLGKHPQLVELKQARLG